MLGPLLRVGQQPFGVGAILLLVAAARVGPGDRPGLDPPPGHLDERLRRCAGDLEVSEVEEVHVWRGVDRPQPPIDRERLDGAVGAEALGGDYLERVARADVLDDPRDVRLELLAGQVRPPLDRPVAGPGRMAARAAWDRAAETLAGRFDQPDGALVRGPDPVRAAERESDDRDLVLVMVEGDDQLADHQRQVGEPERVGVRIAERLDGADQVVAEQADGAAGERELIGIGEVEALERGRDGSVGVGCRAAAGRLARGSGGALPFEQLAVGPADREVGAEAEERVAAEPPALLGRLEQEAGAAVAQLQEGGDGGLGVVDERRDDRNDVPGPGKLAGLLECRDVRAHARLSRRGGARSGPWRALRFRDRGRRAIPRGGRAGRPPPRQRVHRTRRRPRARPRRRSR